MTKENTNTMARYNQYRKVQNKTFSLEALKKQIEKLHGQEFNEKCRYYNCNHLGERSCSCGMDMTFCSRSCAFATNAVCSTRAYESPIYENNRRKKR